MAVSLGDLERAIRIAQKGYDLSEIEECLEWYFRLCDWQQEAIEGRESKIFKWLEGGMKIDKAWAKEMEREFFDEFIPKEERKLINLFVKALKLRDDNQIMEIAAAVRFIKLLKGDYGDPYRAALLIHKRYLDGRGEKWTLQKIAREIKWPNTDSESGMRRLRTLCKEVRFPIASSRDK